MEVRWAPRAVKDLDHIFKRIEQDNSKSRSERHSNHHDGCVSLAEFPERGRPGRMQGRRELVFPGLPYVAVYKVREHAVEISRIWHGAQDWK